MFLKITCQKHKTWLWEGGGCALIRECVLIWNNTVVRRSWLFRNVFLSLHLIETNTLGFRCQITSALILSSHPHYRTLPPGSHGPCWDEGHIPLSSADSNQHSAGLQMSDHFGSHPHHRTVPPGSHGPYWKDPSARVEHMERQVSNLQSPHPHCCCSETMLGPAKSYKS